MRRPIRPSRCRCVSAAGRFGAGARRVVAAQLVVASGACSAKSSVCSGVLTWSSYVRERGPREFSESGPSFATIGPKPVEDATTCPNLCRVWPNPSAAKVGLNERPSWANSGPREWPSVGNCWPNSSKLGPAWADFGPIWLGVDQTWPEYDQQWPSYGQVGPRWAWRRPTLDEFRPNLGRRRPISADVMC